MSGKSLKFIIVSTFAVAMLAGCQSGVRGPQVFTGFNGDPSCPPGPKPCPREYPEFPLPPGGPYLETPPHATSGPARLNLNPAPAPASLTVTR